MSNVGASIFELMTSGNLATMFNPSDSDLALRFPGIWTPEQTNVPYVDFTWNGTNENGQPIGQGIYYIKVTMTDEYGHVNSTTKSVMLVRTEEYIRVNIYNSAGELVRRMEKLMTAGTEIKLETEDLFYIGGGNSSTTIKLGASGDVEWDGKNSLGKNVSNGIYEVRVEFRQSGGYVLYAGKSMTVLTEGKAAVLGDVKILPNPVIMKGNAAAAARFVWTALGQGDVTLKVYNAAGELVSRSDAKVSDTFIDWAAKTENGAKLSTGFYIAVVEAVSEAGIVERKIIKLAITHE